MGSRVMCEGSLYTIQETKLKEKEKKNIMKENPKITVISNNGDSKAGVAFIINDNNMKEDTGKWNHTIVIKGKVSTIQIKRNEQKYTIMNVYMPNGQKKKIETINKIKEYIEKIENPNNLYYDLAKQLSYYLYFFSFLFLLDLLHKKGVWKSVTCHRTDITL